MSFDELRNLKEGWNKLNRFKNEVNKFEQNYYTKSNERNSDSINAKSDTKDNSRMMKRALHNDEDEVILSNLAVNYLNNDDEIRAKTLKRHVKNVAATNNEQKLRIEPPDEKLLYDLRTYIRKTAKLPPQNENQQHHVRFKENSNNSTTLNERAKFINPHSWRDGEQLVKKHISQLKQNNEEKYFKPIKALKGSDSVQGTNDIQREKWAEKRKMASPKPQSDTNNQKAQSSVRTIRKEDEVKKNTKAKIQSKPYDKNEILKFIEKKKSERLTQELDEKRKIEKMREEKMQKLKELYRKQRETSDLKPQQAEIKRPNFGTFRIKSENENNTENVPEPVILENIFTEVLNEKLSKLNQKPVITPRAKNNNQPERQINNETRTLYKFESSEEKFEVESFIEDEKLPEVDVEEGEEEEVMNDDDNLRVRRAQRNDKLKKICSMALDLQTQLEKTKLQLLDRSKELQFNKEPVVAKKKFEIVEKSENKVQKNDVEDEFDTATGLSDRDNKKIVQILASKRRNLETNFTAPFIMPSNSCFYANESGLKLLQTNEVKFNEAEERKRTKSPQKSNFKPIEEVFSVENEDYNFIKIFNKRLDNMHAPKKVKKIEIKDDKVRERKKKKRDEDLKYEEPAVVDDVLQDSWRNDEKIDDEMSIKEDSNIRMRDNNEYEDEMKNENENNRAHEISSMSLRNNSSHKEKDANLIEEFNDSVSDQVSEKSKEIEDQLDSSSSSTTISSRKISNRNSQRNSVRNSKIDRSENNNDVLSSSSSTRSSSSSPESSETLKNENSKARYRQIEEDFSDDLPNVKARNFRYAREHVEDVERYSPSSLERLLYAGINYLDVLSNSAAQLEELDKVRCIGLAQQETVTLAHLLKNQQLERDIALYKEKTTREMVGDDRRVVADRNRYEKSVSRNRTSSYSRETSEVSRTGNTDSDSMSEIATESNVKKSQSIKTEAISSASLSKSESDEGDLGRKKSEISLDFGRLDDDEDSMKNTNDEILKTFWQEEKIHAKQQATLLKMKEEALKQKAKVELYWLEKMKNEIKKIKRGEEKIPMIVEREKLILKNLKQEEENMRLMRKKQEEESEKRLKSLVKHKQTVKELKTKIKSTDKDIKSIKQSEKSDKYSPSFETDSGEDTIVESIKTKSITTDKTLKKKAKKDRSKDSIASYTYDREKTNGSIKTEIETEIKTREYDTNFTSDEEIEIDTEFPNDDKSYSRKSTHKSAKESTRRYSVDDKSKSENADSESVVSTFKNESELLTSVASESNKAELKKIEELKKELENKKKEAIRLKKDLMNKKKKKLKDKEQNLLDEIKNYDDYISKLKNMITDDKSESSVKKADKKQIEQKIEKIIKKDEKIDSRKLPDIHSSDKKPLKAKTLSIEEDLNLISEASTMVDAHDEETFANLNQSNIKTDIQESQSKSDSAKTDNSEESIQSVISNKRSSFFEISQKKDDTTKEETKKDDANESEVVYTEIFDTEVKDGASLSEISDALTKSKVKSIVEEILPDEDDEENKKGDDYESDEEEKNSVIDTHSLSPRKSFIKEQPKVEIAKKDDSDEDWNDTSDDEPDLKIEKPNEDKKEPVENAVVVVEKVVEEKEKPKETLKENAEKVIGLIEDEIIEDSLHEMVKSKTHKQSEATTTVKAVPLVSLEPLAPPPPLMQKRESIKADLSKSLDEILDLITVNDDSDDLLVNETSKDLLKDHNDAFNIHMPPENKSETNKLVIPTIDFDLLSDDEASKGVNARMKEPVKVVPKVKNSQEDLMKMCQETLESVYWPLKQNNQLLKRDKNENEEAKEKSKKEQIEENFNEMVKDLTGELLYDLNKEVYENPEAISKFMPGHTKPLKKSFFKSYPKGLADLDSTKNVVTEKLVRLLSLQKDKDSALEYKKESKSKWRMKKKYDLVENLLDNEMREDEYQWSNYDQEVCEAKSAVADAVFDHLLSDTISVFTKKTPNST